MKKRSIIFFYLFLNSFLLSSQNWLSDTTILAIKFSPSEVFNVAMPTLMAGVEIWPNDKWNFQLEYGLQSIGLFSYKHDNMDWQYKKIRFGMRRHFISDINKERKFSILGFFGKEPLFKKWRRFIGLDIESAPESYVQESGLVRLSDGDWFSFATSKVFRQTKAFAFMAGAQVPLSQRSFMEIYVGLGIKLIDVRYELGRGATMLNPAFPVLIGPVGIDAREGGHGKPYFNVGVKFGFEALQQ